MKQVEVVRGCASGLAQEIWRFWYDDRNHSLVLDDYKRQTRPSKRHKFLDEESAVFWPVPPVVPAWVAQEAKSKFMETLTVEVSTGTSRIQVPSN